MYFSVHWATHVFSLDEREEPGLGTHEVKQFSPIFCFTKQSQSTFISHYVFEKLARGMGGEGRGAGERGKWKTKKREGDQKKERGSTYLHQSPRISLLGLDEDLLDDGLLDGLGGRVGTHGCSFGFGYGGGLLLLKV